MKLSLAPKTADVRTMVSDRLDNVYGLLKSHEDFMRNLDCYGLKQTDFGTINYVTPEGPFAHFSPCTGGKFFSREDLEGYKAQLITLEFLLEAHQHDTCPILYEIV